MKVSAHMRMLRTAFLSPLLVAAVSCSSYTPRHSTAYEGHKNLKRLGYSVQAGAFSDVENASRLMDALREEGIDAYYFRTQSGLYKVRFGDYLHEKMAGMQAEKLKGSGIIDEYFIVGPGEYAAAQEEKQGNSYLRDEIVKTAKNFVDVPYRWGGSSEEGFDCSGLAMAVYDYNGLKIPRSSREQFATGIPVTRSDLGKGDLVFFATFRQRRVSHVGIYIGDDEFIHAPGRGEKIRTDSLSSDYYSKRYVGARTFLD